MVITESYSFDKYMVQEHGKLYIGVKNKFILKTSSTVSIYTPRVKRTLLKAEG